MIVDVEELQRLQARLTEINSVPIEKIEWRRGGQKIVVSEHAVSSWKYIGLSNVYFLDVVEHPENFQP